MFVCIYSSPPAPQQHKERCACLLRDVYGAVSVYRHQAPNALVDHRRKDEDTTRFIWFICLKSLQLFGAYARVHMLIGQPAATKLCAATRRRFNERSAVCVQISCMIYGELEGCMQNSPLVIVVAVLFFGTRAVDRHVECTYANNYLSAVCRLPGIQQIY